ncbi:hypothetical protein JCGZ_05994 [Jatropha curcas]|uniref:Aminotransferase-like plant mobile domain-containing protein n=1 Tax=Jatropha curcas TaxID=180498 RepID=A0A067KZ59_JATCU|nr:hypothetical protein JCGZ_05994 [Jatropha curcas]
MTLTPADYAAITGLRFAGPIAPLDARYQTATLGAQLVRSLLGVTTQTRYTAQGCVSYKVIYRFWAERIRTRLAAWRELPVEARPAALAYTREERDQAAQSFLFYIISSQLLCTSQNKGDPAVLVCLRDLSQVGSFDWATLAFLYHGLDVWTRGSGESKWQFIQPLEVDRYYLGERVYEIQAAPAQRRVPHAPPHPMCLLEGMTAEDREEEYEGSSVDSFLSDGDYATYFSTRLQAQLPEVLEYIQERKKHRTAAHYRAEAEAEAEAAAAPAGPAGAVLGDVPFPPSMEVVLDPALGLGSAIIIPADLRQAPPPLQLDPEHATHEPAQRYQELCRRFEFARSFIALLYSERHERDLEIGRLRRHHSRQSGAVARLQMEVDWLRTMLEVEGIPLDFSEEDDDGSSSDDAPPSPPP